MRWWNYLWESHSPLKSSMKPPSIKWVHVHSLCKAKTHPTIYFNSTFYIIKKNKNLNPFTLYIWCFLNLKDIIIFVLLFVIIFNDHTTCFFCKLWKEWVFGNAIDPKQDESTKPRIHFDSKTYVDIVFSVKCGKASFGHIWWTRDVFPKQTLNVKWWMTTKKRQRRKDSYSE